MIFSVLSKDNNSFFQNLNGVKQEMQSIVINLLTILFSEFIK